MKQIQKIGASSLGIFLTKELKGLGLNKGDYIAVKIYKVDIREEEEK